MAGGVREYDMTTRAASSGRTRERILRAAAERFAGAHYDDVTLAGVADAAGVTVQTVFNHFGSKEGLLTASIAHFAGEVADLRGNVAPGDVDGAVDALMRNYEVLGDGNWRAIADADRQAALRPLLEGARAQHRAWLEQVFGPHLPGGGTARAGVVDALYAATDVGSWKLLRRDLGRSESETRAVLHRLVTAVLEGSAR
ncbi:TetR/AcrR family transcriptional regulator [Agromyces intestinalis]|uniref:TetR/AcrR family transcriptional regulator n=1 Tax=Agromyces intestinalis TaxID=2592652 RepID=A0A5C1YH36_9MICO|nr:TetR/AcrR family transcriptional regulator [Agromyces intestinalis]QEO15494.1 TetR/AcrR family transcriptional regulator [Agromyces intestinalis]